jgi:hypothetical protein
MRARHFRPSIDSLDSRLLLSGGSGIVSGGLAASGSIAGVSSAMQPSVPSSNDPTVVSTIGWYLPGSPQSSPYDPSTPTQGGCD